MADENRSWGYDRIQGALKNLALSSCMVQNLERAENAAKAPDSADDTEL
jgi:hypothetical protein